MFARLGASSRFHRGSKSWESRLDTAHQPRVVKICGWREISLEEGTLHGAGQLEDAMLGGETATGMQRWDGDCAEGEWRAQGAVSGERMGASIFVWLGVISETCVWQRPGCVLGLGKRVRAV